MLSFYFMYKDIPTTKIKFLPNLEVSAENLVDDLLLTAFGSYQPTINDVFDFLEERVFPRTRANADDLLKKLGLSKYEPIEIIKTTHGVMWEDFHWIKFEGEELTYDKVRLR